MAAVDRRNPNLVDFVGLNWSFWTDGVDIEPPDVPSEDTKYGRYCSETMTLRKEDMAIYGHCPAQDDFFLVVCSHCGKVVKPQAFEEHCLRRHGSLTKVYGQCNTTLQQPSHPPSNVSRDRQRGRSKETSVPAATRRTARPQKEAVRLPQMENISQNKPHSSSMQRPRIQPQNSGPLLPSHSSHPSSSSSLGPSSVKPSVQKPTAAQTSQCQTNRPQQETRAYSRLHKNINKKELNKKLEGPDTVKKKLYIQEPTLTMDLTRQQIRKTDSVQPTVERRPAATSPRDSEEPPAKSKATEHLGTFSEKSSRCSKFQLNANSHIVGSKDVSETSPAEDGDSTVEVQPPYPFNQSLLSSDNSDNDEEHTDLPATSRHPKPLGLCTFGSRALFGCSFFTFDRRLHHLHIAVSAMLEDHVNSHLWKKMPQPSSNLRSQHGTPSTPVQTRAKPNPAGSHSFHSTSLENTPNNSKRTKLPPSVSIGPGQQRTSVGQPNKVRLGEGPLIQNTKTAQKVTPLSLSTSSKHVPSSHVSGSGTLSKKIPPLSPLHPSKRNSSVFNESHPKPCPPHSKGRPPEIQPKLGSCDERGLVQKRKSQSPAPSSSPSKQYQRSSPPSRSGMFSWKRDNSQDIWLGVWRKDQISDDDSQGQPY